MQYTISTFGQLSVPASRRRSFLCQQTLLVPISRGIYMAIIHDQFQWTDGLDPVPQQDRTILKLDDFLHRIRNREFPQRYSVHILAEDTVLRTWISAKQNSTTETCLVGCLRLLTGPGAPDVLLVPCHFVYTHDTESVTTHSCSVRGQRVYFKAYHPIHHYLANTVSLTSNMGRPTSQEARTALVCLGTGYPRTADRR